MNLQGPFDLSHLHRYWYQRNYFYINLEQCKADLTLDYS